MDARPLNLIPTYTDYSDTYSTTYGRTTGLATEAAADPSPAELEALADTVDAYRSVVRLARTRPNSREWRKATSAHYRAARTYGQITGLSLPEVAAKICTIASCLPA